MSQTNNLDKIHELVRRTNSSYGEARYALEVNNGDEVRALSYLESRRNSSRSGAQGGWRVVRNIFIAIGATFMTLFITSVIIVGIVVSRIDRVIINDPHERNIVTVDKHNGFSVEVKEKEGNQEEYGGILIEKVNGEEIRIRLQK